RVLQRVCRCDGRGLAERQAFTGLYRLEHRYYDWGTRVFKDDPVEVRLWALACNDADTLPCSKCGINVCEECRYYPRERPERSDRRPHLHTAHELWNIMCLCDDC